MKPELKKFHKDFTDRLTKIFPVGQLAVVTQGYLSDKPHTLRVNTLKSNDAEIEKILHKRRVKFTAHKNIPHCYFLFDISHKKITELSFYSEGKVYLQNAAAQIPALILNPGPGDRVLDLCASPGGKTTQMAALMGKDADITALEPEKFRFERLTHNVGLQGANVKLVHCRAESFKDEEGAPFDLVLADVPCSGSGTFYVNDKASFSHWSLAFLADINKTQKKILTNALRLVKSGGRVLYTTCSVDPEENEMMVSAVLNDNPNISLIEIDDRRFNFLFSPALKSFDGTVFTQNVSLARRILPSAQNQGFFMALFRRD